MWFNKPKPQQNPADNAVLLTEIKDLQLKIGRCFTEIAELRSKYDSLDMLYMRLKGRQNKAKEPEEEQNINSPIYLKTD